MSIAWTLSRIVQLGMQLSTSCPPFLVHTQSILLQSSPTKKALHMISPLHMLTSTQWILKRMQGMWKGVMSIPLLRKSYIGQHINLFNSWDSELNRWPSNRKFHNHRLNQNELSLSNRIWMMIYGGYEE
jgi:hypothetical protein